MLDSLVKTTILGIKVIYADKVFVEKDPLKIFNGHHPREVYSIKAFEDFCEKHNVLYYATFSDDKDLLLKGVMKARAKKKKYVILDTV